MSRRGVRLVTAAVVTAGCLVTGMPPGASADGGPGTLRNAAEIPAPEGARAWRVVYTSQGVQGSEVEVSGIVVAPEGPVPPGGRPVVAWAHPTTGTADACAPSRGADPVADIPWIGALLDAGYVVTATDYEGLGGAGEHPYLVGASEGRSVLDSIRAARGLPTGAGRDAVVFGHSQGGHAALFAGELARTYAPELAVHGIAAGAPVAAPAGFLDDTVDVHGTAGFLVMTALGYRAAYPEVATAPWLPGASPAQRQVAEEGCAIDVIRAFAGVDPRVVFGADPGAVAGWVRRLRENAAGRRASVPVLYWQGGADDLTRVEWAEAYARRACRRGTALDYRVYPRADHVSVLDAARDDVLAFFAARLAGERPESGCPRRTRSRSGSSPRR